MEDQDAHLKACSFLDSQRAKSEAMMILDADQWPSPGCWHHTIPGKEQDWAAWGCIVMLLRSSLITYIIHIVQQNDDFARNEKTNTNQPSISSIGDSLHVLGRLASYIRLNMIPPDSEAPNVSGLPAACSPTLDPALHVVPEKGVVRTRVALNLHQCSVWCRCIIIGL